MKQNGLEIIEVHTCSSSIDHLGSPDNMLRISSYFDIEINSYEWPELEVHGSIFFFCIPFLYFGGITRLVT